MNRVIVHEIKLMQQQRGAVLIVALIMLLLLTLIGVAGIRDTQLQEKMSGGAEDRAIAFQASESALRQAESEISLVDASYSGGCASNTCYKDYSAGTMPSRVCTNTTNAACSESAYWAQYTWTGTNAKAYSGLANVNTQPRYVIERLPNNYSAVASSTNAGSTVPGAKTVRDFLITARGTGRTDNASVILQSMYRVAY